METSLMKAKYISKHYYMIYLYIFTLEQNGGFFFFFFNLYPAVKSWRTIRSNTPGTPYPTGNTLGCKFQLPSW